VKKKKKKSKDHFGSFLNVFCFNVFYNNLDEEIVCGEKVLDTKKLSYLDGSISGKIIKKTVFISEDEDSKMEDTFLLVNKISKKTEAVADSLLGSIS
jgi:hypothetical protein